jgi:hypothetical protein
VLRLAIRAIKPRKPIGAGVLSPADERQRLADDENGPYAGLDVNDLPDPPDMSDADLYGAGSTIMTKRPTVTPCLVGQRTTHKGGQVVRLYGLDE